MSQSSPRRYKSSNKPTPTIKFQAGYKRSAERYAEVGRAFELTIAGILEKMAENGKISEFSHNQANSAEDQLGQDFTVTIKNENGEKFTRSFGVTISARSWNESRIKHPDVPQFFFPMEMKHESIERKILELFNS